MAAIIFNSVTLVQTGERYALGPIAGPPVGWTSSDWFLTQAYDLANGTQLCLVPCRWTGTQLEFGTESHLITSGYWTNGVSSFVVTNWSPVVDAGWATVPNNGSFTVYTATSSGAIRTEVVTPPDMPTSMGWARSSTITTTALGDLVVVYEHRKLVLINEWKVHTYRVNNDGSVSFVSTITGTTEGNNEMVVGGAFPWVNVAANVLLNPTAYRPYPIDAYSTRAVDLTDPLNWIDCTLLVEEVGFSTVWVRNGDNWSSYNPDLAGYPVSAPAIPGGEGFQFRASDGMARYVWSDNDIAFLDVRPIELPPQHPDWPTGSWRTLGSGIWLGIAYDPAGHSTEDFYDVLDPQWSAVTSLDGSPDSGIPGLFGGGGGLGFEPIPGLLLVQDIADDYSTTDYYQLGVLPNLEITGQINQTRIRPYQNARH